MNKKISSFRGLKERIQDFHSEFRLRVESQGGAALYFRAITAQLLWFLLGYLIVKKILPITDVLLSNAIILIFMGLLVFLWSAIKSKMPAWITYLIKGEFFYDFERPMLNFWIFFLSILNIFFILLPPSYSSKKLKDNN
ncbi:MAG: hypothetical protein UY26_C0003G0199 [Candidatus Jorgensenbacteria bacterium GW2011_GWA1_48_13]|uniref:Uncharacterized protein n=2 Tax=Candidatus Joergenseniibacteriota TaxID=1752739 RepID=A0A0G1Z874_9BACT|nr:MAG: hypothetical protein UY26_C0003G0199 [Candidatus Jorgensenbacteria bacterium GW2011_GWA1_48_13]KKU98924.1 MAG: hypothetical protein UY32_C0011G0009 [Candidatus Jorgensenbacteria bacterium GW2011_GWC1_48_8]KKW15154.1 MAG: hypothetical protein UY55_C0002G0212 [Candidatus Jorgensenbacteria bacterium GW2011_GWB1_50_10]